jgi:hypothetical protein
MTGGAFDRLLYTDCRAGMGRGAGGGFQVQAQSAGVDMSQAKMAISWLLYEAPNAWIVQRRPVEEFPLGFGHASVAGYGTAQSRYVGTEATGARQGNHLADCLLTHDPALYGPTRPAQLWRSALWRAEPWDTTDCPQYEGMPPPGPLTVEAVAAWLQDSPAQAAVLARFLSVLENPAGQRVIITAGAPDEALRWIAAATLLLPIRAALEVSFKVFCTNPLQASHRVVAVLKELNPQVIPGRGDSAFVLDAEAATSDEAAVSERARFWTELFASAEDPYDVVDAVELADQMGAGTGSGRADSLVTAWAVTAPDSPLGDPPALLRWLSGADPRLQAEHGPAVARRILATGPPAAALRWIDNAAALGHIDIDRTEVRSLLLTAEITEIREGGTPPVEILTQVEAAAEAHGDAVSELSSAIVLCPDDQQREVDLLLCLSRRHGIKLVLPPLEDRLNTFAVGWLDDPAGPYHPHEWALRDQILEITYDRLHDRIEAHGTHESIGILQRLWRHFADWPEDLADPLYCHLQIAAISELPSEQRPTRLAALMRRALAADNPIGATDDIQRALIEWQALGPAEALLILTILPLNFPVSAEVIKTAVAEIRRVAKQPTVPALDALVMLDRRGNAPLQQPFTALLAGDRDVRAFIQATTGPRFLNDDPYFQGWLARLAQANPVVTAARLDSLLQACLDLRVPGLGVWLIQELSPPLPRMLINRWGRELGGPQTVRATIEGVWWHEDAGVHGSYKDRVADFIAGFGEKLAPAAREQWFLQVREAIDPEQVAAWIRLAGYEPAKPRRGLLGRGKEPR